MATPVRAGERCNSSAHVRYTILSIHGFTHCTNAEPNVTPRVQHVPPGSQSVTPGSPMRRELPIQRPLGSGAIPSHLCEDQMHECERMGCG
ncbi:hypothetical protein E2C01_097749 [Portunus trituberculatus]|uniref:Uncharacterized protein n=1 Tax=Portunus trituberculatus TaxID=210409 RepID=A0A5B7K5M6_PORTR|nr:hypothetical protein [Portunus trituberculatus]